ncbi:MAG: hypothetical protein J6Z32_07380 [Bacteroidales bacterium]|nr:hypothetical protein [Bacteroidales bacterium]
MRYLAKRIVAFVAILLMTVPVMAQYYDIGNEPVGIKWKTMRSKNFSILFPDSTSFSKYSRVGNGYGKHLEKTAARYLAMVERSYGMHADSVRFTYGIPSKFPMVIHPFNAKSNGVTVWGPRQIDYFSLPSTEIISTEPWDVSLATHEGRHAWQMAHFNKGIFKVLYWFAGDNVIGSASGIYPSAWMLEGDAVVAETEMSKGGRGRSAAFLSHTLRCIIPPGEKDFSKYTYGKQRSWDRWRLGSVKAYTPAVYDVGYMLNSMARYKSKDPDFMHNFLNYEVNHFFSANVVASAFKRHAGKTHRQFVLEDELHAFMELNSNKPFISIMNFLKKEENYSPVSLAENPLSISGEKSGYFTVYHSPVEIGKDSVIAVVEGYGTAPYIVLITNENGEWKQKKLTYFDSGTTNLAYYDGVVWKGEHKPHPRWGQVARSYLCGYNVKENEDIDYVGEFGSREGGYLYEPAVVMVSGRPVLYAITYDPATFHLFSAITPICYLDNSSEDVSLLPEYKIEGQAVSFTSVGSEIIYSVLNDEGLSVEKTWMDGGKQFNATLIEPSFHTLTHLKSKGNEIFFVSDYYGNTNLCRMDVTTRKVKLAALADNIDNYYLSELEDDVVYISKGVGDKGCFPFKEKLVNVEVSDDMEFTYPLAEELTRQYHQKWDHPIAKEKVEDEANNYVVEDYNRLSHLFRIHSWYPANAILTGETSGSEFIEMDGLGVTLHSQNTLGTLRASASYSFKRASRFGTKTRNLHGAHATLTYSGFYPVISAEVHFNDKVMISDNKHSFRSEVLAYLPLEYDLFKSELEIVPFVGWQYRNDESIPEIDLNQISFRQIERNQIAVGIESANYIGMAKAQIYPRWGIGGSIAGYFNPNGGDKFGTVYAGRLFGYLPGFGFNHGLRLSYSYQRQEISGKRFWMDNAIDLPRGYTEDFYGRNYMLATADYAIPIYLGDVSLGFFAYLKQLRVTPFFDFGRVEMPRTVSPFRNDRVWEYHKRFSYGADAVLCANFFRIGFPFQVGFRYARTNKPVDYGMATPLIYDGKGRKNYFGFLLGITIR